MRYTTAAGFRSALMLARAALLRRWRRYQRLGAGFPRRSNAPHTCLPPRLRELALQVYKKITEIDRALSAFAEDI